MPSMVRKFLAFFGFVDADESKTGNKSTNKRSNDDKPREVKSHPIENERLYVGNLNYSVKEEELIELFEKAGEVKKAEIVRYGKSRRSKGFGFITMSSIDDAKKAARMFNGKDFEGRDMAVTGAKNEGRRTGGNNPKSSGRNSRDSSNSRDNNISKSSHKDEWSPGGAPDSRSSQKSRDGRDGGPNRKRSGGRGKKKAISPDQQVKPMEVATVSSSKLVMSNLADDFKPDDLSGLLKGIGTISESEVSDGKVQLEMASVDEAQEVVRLLDGKDFMGKTLSVSEA